MLLPSQFFGGFEVIANRVPNVRQCFLFSRALRPTAGQAWARDAVSLVGGDQRNGVLHNPTLSCVRKASAGHRNRGRTKRDPGQITVVARPLWNSIQCSAGAESPRCTGLGRRLGALFQLANRVFAEVRMMPAIARKRGRKQIPRHQRRNGEVRSSSTVMRRP